MNLGFVRGGDLMCGSYFFFLKIKDWLFKKEGE